VILNPPLDHLAMVSFKPSVLREIDAAADTTHMVSGNGLKKSTLRQLFGRANANIESCLGASALLAESMGIVEKGRDLMCHAGLYGFYASAMTEARANAWLSEICAKPFDGCHPQHFITGMSQQKLVKRAMYCCQHCMREDEARYGLAFWHTVHQIPGVYHCPTHQIPLLGPCLGCGRSQGADHAWNLPALTCPHCGAHRFSGAVQNISRGYARHLSLIGKVCAGRGEFLRPMARTQLLAKAFNGDSGSNAQLIAHRLLEMWECASMAELSAVLSTRITAQFIEEVVRGTYAGANPMALLAIVSIVESILESKSREGLGSQRLPSSIPHVGFSTPPAGLAAALEIVGLPATVGIQLVKGDSLTKICAYVGIPYPRLKRQVTLMLDRNIDELCAGMTDDDAGQAGRRNLQALADRLHRPCRNNNRFRRQNSNDGLEELRVLNRSKVCRYLEQGIQTRKQLYSKNSDLGVWCRKFDPDWFDAMLPSIPQAERRGVGRRKGGRNSLKRSGLQPTDAQQVAQCFESVAPDRIEKWSA
jgi:hypothetical protein